MVYVRFVPNTGEKPRRVLAEAELHWSDDEGVLAGLKLVGFTIWRSRESPDGLTVTLPARAYGAGSERRYFNYLCPQEHSRNTDLVSFKVWIATEFRRQFPDKENHRAEQADHR